MECRSKLIEFGTNQSALYQIFDRVMACQASWSVFARKGVTSSCIHQFTTYTVMRFAYLASQSQTDRNHDSLIVKTQTAWRDRNRQHTISAVRGWCGQKPGSSVWILCVHYFFSCSPRYYVPWGFWKTSREINISRTDLRSSQPLVVGNLIQIWEGSAESNGISPLHANGHSLEQEWSFPRVKRRCGQSTTQITEKNHALIVYRSDGFDRYWYKIVNCLDSLVLDVLEHRGSFRCCAWCVWGDLTMRCHGRVRTRNIPCDTFAHFPRNQRHSVCSLFVVQEQTGRLLGSRDPGSDARTEDYVIQHIVPTRAPSTPPAWQPSCIWMTKYQLHPPQTHPRGWKFTGSKAAWVGRVAAAEAKKAEGASKATLRIPKPPHLTGKFACIQCWSDSSQLEILPKIARCNSSNRTSAGWEAHGVALRMYWTLMDPKEFLRITMESWEEMYDIRSEALWRSSHFALRTESMAAPSIRGAPRRTGALIWNPGKLGGKLSGKESEISSHLLLLRLRPISEPRDSTMATSWATVEKSPPPDTYIIIIIIMYFIIYKTNNIQ